MEKYFQTLVTSFNLNTRTHAELGKLHGILHVAWEKLLTKHPKDANAGVVRQKMAMVFLLSGIEYMSTGLNMLREARVMIQTETVLDVSHLLSTIDMHIACVQE